MTADCCMISWHITAELDSFPAASAAAAQDGGETGTEDERDSSC